MEVQVDYSFIAEPGWNATIGIEFDDVVRKQLLELSDGSSVLDSDIEKELPDVHKQIMEEISSQENGWDWIDDQFDEEYCNDIRSGIELTYCIFQEYLSDEDDEDEEED